MKNKKISEINDINTLREFYYCDIRKLLCGDFSEEHEKKFLNSVSKKELKKLYAIISTIPIQSYKSKIDILYMFKSYFDDESRTNDLNRRLMY